MSRIISMVQCVSKKRDKPQRARNLYTSQLFTNAAAYAEKISDDWFIISAKYGLVRPTDILVPYDVTLKDMSANERRAWAKRVFLDFEPNVKPSDTVVMLAGTIYRRDLVKMIEGIGCKVEIPMKGLRIGEQVSWLKRQLRDL
jgi:cytoplasmic iron level regulating protein YaaA (DUF328/UPF0246 family)